MGAIGFLRRFATANALLSFSPSSAKQAVDCCQVFLRNRYRRSTTTYIVLALRAILANRVMSLARSSTLAMSTTYTVWLCTW